MSFPASLFVLTEPLRVFISDNTMDVYHQFSETILQHKLSVSVDYTRSYQYAFGEMVANNYDVYLLNDQLQDHDGLELMKKSMLYGCEKPVIILGSNGSDSLAVSAVVQGAVNYIDKHNISAVQLFHFVQHAYDQYIEHKRKREIAYKQQRELNDLRTNLKKLVDSINYAKYIQDILLIDRKQLFDLFGEYLIVYKPKDIVSGDFYYATRKGKYKYLAVADCTGHGVPGAFMSILCNDILKQAVDESNYTGEILNKVDYDLRNQLKQHLKGGISDGMDIGLIRIDEERQEIQFSGAYRPCLLLRGGSFITYAGDKKSIGYSAVQPRSQEFSTQKFRYKQGDRLFLYSDGFADQFGGLNNRKLSKRRFRSMLLETSYLPMHKQSDVVNKYFNDWKQSKPQTDDVLLLGISF